MLKAICILVLIISVGAIVYSVISAINTAKRNKAKDEANRQIFMAKMNKEKMQYPSAPQVQNASKVSEINVSNSTEKKQLDYDNMVDDTDFEAANGKSLKDFFG